MKRRQGGTGVGAPRVQEAPAVVQSLVEALGAHIVLWQPYDMHLYAYDGSIDRARPQAVVLPTCTDEARTALRICAEYSSPVTPRGAGTGLSGGSIPVE